MAASSSSTTSSSSSSSKSRSNAPVLPLTFSFPSPALESPAPPSSLASLPSTFAYSSNSSSSMSSSLFHRASSPTRVNLSPTTSANAAANAFRISLSNRSMSPTTRGASSVSRSPHFPAKFTTKFPAKFPAKKTCMCSPTSHPGSFRCAIHRNNNERNSRDSSSGSMSCSPMRLNLRRSAMTNSLVRIGTVEGDWVRRALTALIRPSSHQQRRRGEFRPRPSRLSIMSSAVVDDDR